MMSSVLPEATKLYLTTFIQHIDTR